MLESKSKNHLPGSTRMIELLSLGEIAHAWAINNFGLSCLIVACTARHMPIGQDSQRDKQLELKHKSVNE